MNIAGAMKKAKEAQDKIIDKKLSLKFEQIKKELEEYIDLELMKKC